MAKQNSLIKIKGNLGGMSFYERNGEHYVRMTPSVSKNSILKGDRYKRNRENMAEFSGAARAEKYGVFSHWLIIVAKSP